MLANRLSAEGARVLLLEAGGDDRPTHNPGQFFSNLMIHVPGRLLVDAQGSEGQLASIPPSRTRAPAAAPMSGPRGKVLGGSSSINGLLYIRGQHADYDGWAPALGCEGWGWDDVLTLTP